MSTDKLITQTKNTAGNSYLSGASQVLKFFQGNN